MKYKPKTTRFKNFTDAEIEELWDALYFEHRSVVPYKVGYRLRVEIDEERDYRIMSKDNLVGVRRNK